MAPKEHDLPLMCNTIDNLNERRTRDEAESLIAQGFRDDNEELKQRGYDMLTIITLRHEHEVIAKRQQEQLAAFSKKIEELTNTVNQLHAEIAKLRKGNKATWSTWLKDHWLVALFAAASVTGNLYSIGGKELLTLVAKLTAGIFGFGGS